MCHTPLRLLVSLALMAGVPASALAVPGGPTVKLHPNDPRAFHEFGRAVAVSTTTAIVGAVGDNTNGLIAGAAYLFDLATGQQIRKLLPSDGAPQDWFGISVAIHDNIAVVGAYGDDDNGGSSGSAYVFDVSTGQQLFKLLASDGAAGDSFGTSVATNGFTVVVGAYATDHHGTDSGAVYFFDAATGLETDRWTPADGQPGDQFGFPVAISGQYVLTGAALADHGGTNAGAAYVFDLSQGVLVQKLVRNDRAADDRFGYAIAVSGSTACVTSRGDDDQGTDSGSAYLFDLTTGNQIAKLLPADGAAEDRFGLSAAAWGSTLVIGSHNDDAEAIDSGSAYVFDLVTARQVDKLVPGDGAQDDWFGTGVGVNGTTAIVATYRDDDNGTSSGSAYLFSTCPPSLTLAAVPAIAFPGDTLNVTTFGGLPNKPNLLFVVDVNGIPVFSRIAVGLFGSECKHRLVATVPAGFAGFDITFAAIGLGPSGYQLSNPGLVQFQ